MSNLQKMMKNLLQKKENIRKYQNPERIKSINPKGKITFIRKCKIKNNNSRITEITTLQ